MYSKYFWITDLSSALCKDSTPAASDRSKQDRGIGGSSASRAKRHRKYSNEKGKKGDDGHFHDEGSLAIDGDESKKHMLRELEASDFVRDSPIDSFHSTNNVHCLLLWQAQVLSWNFDSIYASRNPSVGVNRQDDGGPKNPVKQDLDIPPLQPIPKTFTGAENYIDSFRPVLLLELQSIIKQGIEENAMMETLDVYRVTEVRSMLN